jgi:hypothetical protein
MIVSIMTTHSNFIKHTKQKYNRFKEYIRFCKRCSSSYITTRRHSKICYACQKKKGNIAKYNRKAYFPNIPEKKPEWLYVDELGRPIAEKPSWLFTDENGKPITETIGPDGVINKVKKKKGCAVGNPDTEKRKEVKGK